MLNNKLSKSLSLFLATLMVVNSMLFAVIVHPKPAQALPGDFVTVVKDFSKDVWGAIEKAFREAKAATDKAFQSSSVAFDTWDKTDSIMKDIGTYLFTITMQIIADRMTNDIVAWLNGGAKGSPKVTQDFGQKLRDAADLAAGAVVGGLLGLNNNELCDPNFLKVKLTIALNPLQAPTFPERYK